MTTRSSVDFDGAYPVYENETTTKFNLGFNENVSTGFAYSQVYILY
jgi:hypothetical protein